jgi:hypothetical protein
MLNGFSREASALRILLEHEVKSRCFAALSMTNQRKCEGGKGSAYNASALTPNS